MVPNQITLRPWDRRDNSRSIWLWYRLKDLHKVQTIMQPSQQEPLWQRCCPGKGGFVPAEFMLLWLADIYVSQTESNLLPTDKLYRTDVNTVGEVTEAFLQRPGR